MGDAIDRRERPPVKDWMSVLIFDGRGGVRKLTDEEETQPYSVPQKGFVLISGNARSPDFKVWHTDGRISLHEVTLAARSQTPPLQQRHTAAAQFCRERGWQYHLHTETTLPQGSELANLLALWGYRPSRYADPVIRHALFTALDKGEQRLYPLVMSLSEECTTTPIQVAVCLYHLLWHDQIGMDWQRLLFQDAVPQADTRLWLTEKAGAS